MIPDRLHRWLFPGSLHPSMEKTTMSSIPGVNLLQRSAVMASMAWKTQWWVARVFSPFMTWIHLTCKYMYNQLKHGYLKLYITLTGYTYITGYKVITGYSIYFILRISGHNCDITKRGDPLMWAPPRCTPYALSIMGEPMVRGRFPTVARSGWWMGMKMEKGGFHVDNVFLVGGLEHFLFSHILGIIIPIV